MTRHKKTNTALKTNRQNWKIGHWQVAPDNNEISNGAIKVQIEPKAMAVLIYLAERANKTISNQELQDSLWQGVAVSDNTVRRIMTHLRKAFEDDISRPEYIATVSRKGYRLVAAVQRKAISSNAKIPGLMSWPIVFCLAVLAAFYWYQTRVLSASHWLEQGQIKPTTSLPGRELAPTYSPDGEAIIFAHSEVNSGIYRLHIKWLNEASSYPLVIQSNNPFSPVWSPNGKQIAFTDMTNCQVVVAELADDWRSFVSQKMIHQCGFNTFPQLAWSADGRSLFFNDQRPNSSIFQQYRLDQTSGKVDLLDFGDDLPDNGFFKLLPHPTKNLWILLSRTNQDHTQIWRFDPVSRQKQMLHEINRFSHHIDWCGQSEPSLIFSDNHQLVIIGLDGEIKPLSNKKSQEFSYLTCSPTKNEMIFASRQRYHSLVKMKNPRLKQAVKIESNYVYRSTRSEENPVWSNQGHQLAFVSDRSGRWQIWMGQKDAVSVFDQVKFTTRPELIGWSADDSQLLVRYEQSLILINIDDGSYKPIPIEKKDVSYAVWSYSDNTVLYQSEGSDRIQSYNIDNHQLAEISAKQVNSITGSLLDNSLYFTKTTEKNGLWKLSQTEGHETLITKLIPSDSRLQVFKDGIYFHHHQDQKSGLFYYDFRTNEIKAILHDSMDQGHDFTISADESEIVYITWDNYQSDLKMISVD